MYTNKNCINTFITVTQYLQTSLKVIILWYSTCMFCNTRTLGQTTFWNTLYIKDSSDLNTKIPTPANQRKSNLIL